MNVSRHKECISFGQEANFILKELIRLKQQGTIDSCLIDTYLISCYNLANEYELMKCYQSALKLYNEALTYNSQCSSEYRFLVEKIKAGSKECEIKLKVQQLNATNKQFKNQLKTNYGHLIVAKSRIEEISIGTSAPDKSISSSIAKAFSTVINSRKSTELK